MNKIENDNLKQLVIDAQNDVEGAFEKLYKETIKHSYATASLLLTNKEDIEDVLQNSYMYAAKYLKDLRNPENFRNWFGVIIKHECQKHISKNKRISDVFAAVIKSKDFDVSSDGDLPFDMMEQKDLNQTVHSIVDKLPDDRRICVVLYYFERNTLPEIAEILGVPEGTVKSRLYSARKQIEKEFRKLQKKDERLLGISVIPLLAAFFASEFKNAVVPAALAECSPLIAAAEGAAVAATAGAAVTGGVSASAGAATGAAATGAASGVAASGAAGAAVATKVAAVAVAAAVTTGGGIATVNYVNEKKNDETTYISVAEITEEYATAAAIFSEETVFVTESGVVAEISSETMPLTAFARRTQPTALPSAAALPTEKQTSVQAEITAAQTAKPETTKSTTATKPTTTTTKPTTTTPTTTKPTTTKAQTTTQKATTTAPLTTDAAEVFGVSNGVIREYTGSDSEVDIPSSVGSEEITAIGIAAFAGNTDMTSVTIPSTVTKIGQEAFAGCRYLAYVTLPSSVDSIGIGAFCECTSLRKLNIPSGVESIGDDAFADCTNLTSVTIPSSVTSIGENAFGGCDNLTIRCSEGSAAHDYAVANSINYELI